MSFRRNCAPRTKEVACQPSYFRNQRKNDFATGARMAPVAKRLKCTALETILQPKLDEPRRHRRGLDFSKARRAKDEAWICKLRMVEGIEKLGAKFQRRRFAQPADFCGFGQRCVEVGLMRPAEGGAPGVAISGAISDLRKGTAGHSRIRRCGERERIEIV